MTLSECQPILQSQFTVLPRLVVSRERRAAFLAPIQVLRVAHVIADSSQCGDGVFQPFDLAESLTVLLHEPFDFGLHMR
jgi:hypothetical protein